MLVLTLENEALMDRVFCGYIRNSEDLDRLVLEMRKELESCKIPVFVELWERRPMLASKLKRKRKAS